MNNLITALAKARAEFPVIQKRGFNPYYKSEAHPKGSPFVIYEDLVDGITPALKKHHLEFEHCSGVTDGVFWFGSRFVYVPDGTKSEPVSMPIVADPNAQKTSGSITYAKRVTLGAAAAVSTETDVDGNDSVAPPKQTQGKPISAPPKPFDQGKKVAQEKMAEAEVYTGTKEQKRELAKIFIEIGKREKAEVPIDDQINISALAIDEGIKMKDLKDWVESL